MVHYNFAYPNHVIFDLYGVNPIISNDLSSIMKLGRRLAKKLRSDIVGEVFHTFEPQGVIYVATLLQSHIAVHTWPELGYVSLDVYTCSDVSVKEIEKDVLRFFRPKKYKIIYLNREVSRRPRMDMIYKEWRYYGNMRGLVVLVGIMLIALLLSNVSHAQTKASVEVKLPPKISCTYKNGTVVSLKAVSEDVKNVKIGTLCQRDVVPAGWVMYCHTSDHP
jgi:S-adenosylmethionine decarboxylase proenzyme